MPTELWNHRTSAARIQPCIIEKYPCFVLAMIYPGVYMLVVFFGGVMSDSLKDYLLELPKEYTVNEFHLIAHTRRTGENLNSTRATCLAVVKARAFLLWDIDDPYTMEDEGSIKLKKSQYMLYYSDASIVQRNLTLKMKVKCIINWVANGSLEIAQENLSMNISIMSETSEKVARHNVYGDQCDTDATCSGEQVTCHPETAVPSCACQNGLLLDKFAQCSRPRPFGSMCLVFEDCDSNLQCDASNKTCRCEDEHSFDNVSQQCIRSASYGQLCGANRICSDCTECINSFCRCGKGLQYYEGRCVKGISYEMLVLIVFLIICLGIFSMAAAYIVHQCYRVRKKVKVEVSEEPSVSETPAASEI